MSKRRTSLTNFILFALEKTVRAGELILESSEDLKRWMYEVYGDYPKPIQKGTLSQAIRRLRERGLIEQERRETGEIVMRLTQVGKEFVLLAGDEGKEWDGKWRIVIFDIPESKRLVRDVLRSRLKTWGFSRWQQSVWASKKNLTYKLRELIKELKIANWVLVIESDNVG